jgi:hypothetical protein
MQGEVGGSEHGKHAGMQEGGGDHANHAAMEGEVGGMGKWRPSINPRTKVWLTSSASG